MSRLLGPARAAGSAAVAAVAALLLLAAPPAEATLVRGFTLSAMTLEAHSVVHGEVVGSEVVYDAQRGNVYTHTTVRIIERWAGDGDGAYLVVRQIGGLLDGVETSVVGTMRLDVGAEVVLFTRTDGFLHYLVGMAQGGYEVLRDPGTPATVARSTSGLTRIGLRGPVQADAPSRTALATLKARVADALERAGEVTR